MKVRVAPDVEEEIRKAFYRGVIVGAVLTALISALLGVVLWWIG